MGFMAMAAPSLSDSEVVVSGIAEAKCDKLGLDAIGGSRPGTEIHRLISSPSLPSAPPLIGLSPIVDLLKSRSPIVGLETEHQSPDLGRGGSYDEPRARWMAGDGQSQYE